MPHEAQPNEPVDDAAAAVAAQDEQPEVPGTTRSLKLLDQTTPQTTDAPSSSVNIDIADVPLEFSFQQCADVERAFTVRGAVVREGYGRTVERITIDGHTHYLKRYWWQPQSFWRRIPRTGLHELRMIQWLHKHGFRGPQVVARGRDRRGRFTRRVFFLMREVEGERDLVTAIRTAGQHIDRLLTDFARHLARLHDRGFVHVGLKADDIRVRQSGQRWLFRHIDLEASRNDAGHTPLAWRDLVDLTESIDDAEVRDRLRECLIREYPAARNHTRNVDKMRQWLIKNMA